MTMSFVPPVVPDLHPVSEEDIEALRAITDVPAALTSFWLASGYGFFTHDARGNRCDEAVANRLLHPGEVLEIIQDPTEQYRMDLAVGLPFFDKMDLEFLAISADGFIFEVYPDGTRFGIAGDLDEFLSRLVEDPLFYEGESAEEEWCASQRAVVLDYLKREGLAHGEVGDRPAWHVWPYVAVWAVESLKSPGRGGWWVISGDLPTDYTPCSPAPHPREGVKDIAERWRDLAYGWGKGEWAEGFMIGSPDEQKELAPLLAARADLLLSWVANPQMWEGSATRRFGKNTNGAVGESPPSGPPDL